MRDCTRCNERPRAATHHWCRECQNAFKRNAYVVEGRPTLTAEQHLRMIARRRLRDAVKTGRIVKPDCCEVCGRMETLHGHHDDYSQPLVARWLCAWCHRGEHEKGRRTIPRLRRAGL